MLLVLICVIIFKCGLLSCDEVSPVVENGNIFDHPDFANESLLRNVSMTDAASTMNEVQSSEMASKTISDEQQIERRQSDTKTAISYILQ
jgi:hypothetical protein